MATTIVNLGKNFNSAVDYLTQGKPHVDDDVIQGKRALDISAINGSANPTYFKKDNDEFLKKNPKVHNKSVKCIKTIIGFDPKYMYYGSLRDRKIAMKVARRVAKRKYPHNSSLIVIQADTPNHILHAHVLTVSREFDTGNSSTHKATFLKTIPYTDEAIHHFHLKTDLKPNPLSRTPKHNTSMSVYKIEKRDHDALWNYQLHLKRDSPKDHTYSYIDDLHNRIYGCVHISKNLNEFNDYLHKYGVQLKPVFRMRKNKRTGQRQLHYYAHPTNNKNDIYVKLDSDMIHDFYSMEPKIAKESNLKGHQGEYIRYKKHFTYGFKDKLGKYRIVRDKKLGRDTAPLEVNKQFDRNIKFGKQHSHDEIKELGIKKSKKTFTEYTAGNSSTKIHGVHKPFINKARIKEPVMTFHPESHKLSKAINDLTSIVNKIKNTAQNDSKRKEYLEQAYENSLLRKKQAEKVNEINDENRAIYFKVSQDNYLTKKAYYQQQAAYEWELKKAQRQRDWQR